jgi:hypothetical protein
VFCDLVALVVVFDAIFQHKFDLAPVQTEIHASVRRQNSDVLVDREAVLFSQQKREPSFYQGLPSTIATVQLGGMHVDSDIPVHGGPPFVACLRHTTQACPRTRRSSNSASSPDRPLLLWTPPSHDAYPPQEFIHVAGWGPENHTGWTTDEGKAIGGSGDIFCIEDCTFTQSKSQSGVAWIQGHYGARVAKQRTQGGVR